MKLQQTRQRQSLQKKLLERQGLKQKGDDDSFSSPKQLAVQGLDLEAKFTSPNKSYLSRGLSINNIIRK